MTTLLTNASANTFTTIFGGAAADSLTANGHIWTADPGTGLYSTASNLAAEWQTDYSALQAGQSLNFIQHLEANAQAVFLNTGLNSLKAAQQALDRMDVQRQFDAMAQAMLNAGIDVGANGQLDDQPITQQGYLKIEQALQGDSTLEELAMQGHGLNNTCVARYKGYTNDFQNNVDNDTLYIGGGLDNNQSALANFIDDVVLGHLPFPTVPRSGELQQLNQNGDAENTLADASGAWNYAGTQMVLTAGSFSKTEGNASSTPYAPPVSDTPPPAGYAYSQLTGLAVANTITLNGDVWTLDPSGLYVTTTDLASQWQSAYQAMQAGATLTAAQFIEGNAEALFENTKLATVAVYDSVQLAYDRMDVQREIDAIVGALQAAGLDPNQPLTVTTWLRMQHALQGNATLEELALQGHGLNDPSSPVYNGYTNDFQNNVDQRTLYVGPGADSGERAIAALFDDAGLTHAPFAVIVQDGKLIQLNQNGDNESTAQLQVDEYNQLRFNQVLKPTDFNIPGNPSGAQAPGTIATVFGGSVASTITVNGDVWTAGADGKYHTTVNLWSQWESYYQTMLAGNGAQLTAIQRMEGNAEAVFDNTGLNKTRVYNNAKQQAFREDAAREFDAIGAAMTQLGLGGKLLNAQDYLAIGQAIQSNPVWAELAIQGHGLNSPPSAKYRGYTNDFQNNSDNSTYFVGGGVDNGEKAIANFFDDVSLSHLAFPVVSQNGDLEQLNQNGDQEDTLATVVAATNEAMFTRVFVASDFSRNAMAVGEVVNVAYPTPLQTDPTPTAGDGQILSLFGQPISASLTLNGHSWVADSQGLYQTQSDLTLEWWNSYQAGLAGTALTLTQAWEAQAEAVFLNTGLSKSSEGQQATDRMDVQRVIDAVVTEMGKLGIGAGPLTDAQYLAISHGLQGDAALEQMAIEGVGSNNPWVAGATEYNGYTNDFQWTDGSTLYLGAGPDDGQRAIADFFGDAIMTKLAFPVIMQNGEVTQLNQNGNGDSTLNQAVEQVNATLFGKLLTSANFVKLGAMPPAAPAATPAAITGYYGDTLPGAVTINGHAWVADSNGIYQTSANLEIEWRADYQAMLAGQGASLTATQRLEGNMEAFLENSNVNTMWNGAAAEEKMRVDIERVIDAIGSALQIDQTTYGFSATAAFTEASYMQLSNTIHGSAQLEELALQGLGMVKPTSAKYRGAYRDIFSGADWSTYFVGGGADNGNLAVAYAMEDMLGNIAFATNFSGGAWQTTDSTGNIGVSALTAAGLMNQAMYRQVFTASDFSASATATGAVDPIPGAASATVTPIAAPTTSGAYVVTLSGATIASTMTVNGHIWTADGTGLFHTSNLAAEWQADYAAMLAGRGASLTAIQRAEGNAEAVFEAAGVPKLSAALSQELREDVQRQLDAEAAAMAIDAKTEGFSATAAPTAASYVAMARTIQSNDALEELALQGHGVSGVTGAAKARYSGIVGDAAGLTQVAYKGGGLNNWSNALGTYLQQNIMGDAPFAVTRQWGGLSQFDETGNTVLSVAGQVKALAATMGGAVLTKKSFTA